MFGLKKLGASIAVVCLSFGMTQVAHAAVINTVPVWDGSSSLSSWGGSGSTSTYGETFLAAGSTLNDFTFYVNTNGNTISALAQVYAWSGALGGHGPATGPALFSSNVSVFGNGLQPITVNTGNLALTAGNEYVALLTVTDNSQAGGASWGLIWADSNVANDGKVVWFNNNANLSLLNSQAWDGPWINGSLAWTANFSNGASHVPEPGSMALVGLGILGAGIFRRKKTA
ncbi:PEP-CTERM sorting domain-containing protein [Zoogloea sp.]|uniref:PEP-CTERM sorting domain-containing protein n=1 Tax=Zoogloea sp. TaxID=49181 RepID=UPI0035B2404C